MRRIALAGVLLRPGSRVGGRSRSGFGRGARPLLCGLAVLAGTLAIGGCRNITAYSDSILATPSTPGAPAGGWHGDAVQREIRDQGFAIGGWHPAPGTQMNGYNAHPAKAGGDFPLSSAPSGFSQGVVYSFGTNDANYFAWGLPTGDGRAHTATQAVAEAKRLMERARLWGADCVVWILGNTRLQGDRNAYGPPAQVRDQNPNVGWITGETAARRYDAYMTTFVDGIRNLGGNPNVGAGTIKLRLADWGLVAQANPLYTDPDGVHPSELGGIELGRRVASALSSCG